MAVRILYARWPRWMLALLVIAATVLCCCRTLSLSKASVVSARACCSKSEAPRAPKSDGPSTPHQCQVCNQTLGLAQGRDDGSPISAPELLPFQLLHVEPLSASELSLLAYLPPIAGPPPLATPVQLHTLLLC